jgi:pheromone shutdown protein TraB
LKTGIEDGAPLNRRFVKVKDFESLLDDISSFKGFWRNKITRILLVVVFTNLGASLGTFVAIPLMLKVLA